MTFDFSTIQDFVKQFGLPLSMMFGWAIAGYYRIWSWGYQLSECRADYERRLEEAAERVRRSEERADKWQDTAFRLASTVDRATEVTRQAVQK